MTPELLEEQALWLRWLWRNYLNGVSPSGPNLRAWGQTLGARMKKDLPKIAMDAIIKMHKSVLAGDSSAALAEWNNYQSAIKDANGGTSFGIFADQHSAGYQIADKCKATPGSVPMWGQDGEFALSVSGLPVKAKVGRGYGALKAHFEFHGDVFPTGYRSIFDDFHAEKTVEQAARFILESMFPGRQIVRPNQSKSLQLLLF